MTSKEWVDLVQRSKFPETPHEWRDIPAKFQEGSLSIFGHPVMEDWERPYMEQLAEVATMNGGVVLEIGFGLGISANHIHRHPIEKHIVVEANADVFAKLQAFAQQAAHPVEPHLGLWQDVLPELPDASIDGILFDTYPLCADDIDNHYTFFQTAFRLLKSDGIFTYFSDEVDDFSTDHRQLLLDTGFRSVDGRACPVNAPADCPYWNPEHKTMLVPIVTK